MGEADEYGPGGAYEMGQDQAYDEAPVELSPELAEAFETARARAEAAGAVTPEEAETEPVEAPVPARTSSRVLVCIFCESEIPSVRNAYRKVIGFERQRKAGGTNAVRLRQPTEEWACSRCVDSIADGRDPRQAAIL